MRLREQPRYRPADDNERMARSSRSEGARGAGRRHVRHLRRHPRDGGKPDRSHGCARLPRVGVEVEGGHPDRVCAGLPHPTRQPVRDHLVSAVPGDGSGADDPARRGAPSDVAVRRNGARGLRSRRLLRAGRLRHRVRVPEVHREARLLGPRREVQRAQAGLDQRRGRLPQRRRHLHRLHDARLPRQVHALHGRAAPARACRRWRAASSAERYAVCERSP